MDTVIKFIGHFHPLLVHLPIGILLFAIVLHILSKRSKWNTLADALPFAYLTGALGALFSGITGLALASYDNYDANLIFKHQWLGISVTVFSFTLYYLVKKNKTRLLKWGAAVLFVLIILTGHYGGTLTHGEGYLTQKIQKENGQEMNNKPFPLDAQEALVYKDIIQPILQEKCYGCHSSIKQKGKLRLDEKEWIVKGGADGIIIHAGDAHKSRLYQNIILDPVDEKHMPPKGKPQITDQERILLAWWINNGASFEKKVKEFPQTQALNNIFISLQNKEVKKIALTSPIPSDAISPANEKAINGLKMNGVTIVPVALNSNYLTANFITLSHSNDSIHDFMNELKKHLVWIKMQGMQWSDPLSEAVAACTQLTKLSLNQSSISDAQLLKLNTLQELQYLNLVNTKISLQGLLQLTNLKKLRQLYIGQTNITANDLNKIKNIFPIINVDFGNYQIEKLITDTQLVKAPEKK